MFEKVLPSIPRPKPRATVLLAGLLTLLGPAALSGTTVGSADSFNCYPFACGVTDGINGFQQQYNPNAFAAGPLLIQTLRFFSDPTVVGNLVDEASFDLYLSTAALPFGSMSGVLGNNVGSDEAFFGSVNFGPAMPASFSITGSTPFGYDPANGALLLRVVTTSATTVRGFYGGGFSADHTGAVLLRNWTTTSGVVAPNTTGALVTEFVSVPEPASLGLTLVCLAGLAAWRGRNRV